jgi:hypothetical protein
MQNSLMQVQDILQDRIGINMPYPSSLYNNLRTYTITPGMTAWIDASVSNSYDPANARMLDISGNNNHLVLINTPSVSSDYGGVFRLDGTNDYAYFANSPTVNFPGDFTIEYWEYRPLSFGPLGSLQKRGYTWTVGGWATYAYDQDNFLGWRNFDTTPYNFSFASNFKIYNGRWYHNVFTRDQGYIKIYSNGEIRGIRATIDTYDYTNTENLEVGRWGSVVGGDYTFGPIRIYQSALTAQQVKNHYLADVNRFLKAGTVFNNTLSYQEDKNFNSQRLNTLRSAAKYSTDASVGTINTFATYKDQYTDLNNQFIKFSDGISPKFRITNTVSSMTTLQKEYHSNLNQETINNIYSQLDILNKNTTKLLNTIQTIKAGTITLDGVYPSSKYR